MARLTEAVLRETAAAYNAAEGNQVKAAEALDILRPALQGRLRSIKKRLPDGTLKDWPVARGGMAPKPERTLAEDVALTRAQGSERHAQARLKDALREVARLQDEIADLRWASNAGFKPAEWTLPTRRRGKSEHTPYLLTSDFQAGEVIRADETEAGYGYDSATFVRRYRALIAATINIATKHSGDWTFPGFIYARGGDTISGGIHEELRDTDDMTPIEAVRLVFEEEAAGIRHLAEAFGKVEVKSSDAAGNHDRTVFKPRSKNAAGHSYDLMISFMLQREFRNDKRVTFQTSRSFDVVFPIYDQTVLLTHGDRVGSRGGMGFIGPAATILRGAQRVIQEQAALGRHVDAVHMGHFHTPLYYDWVLCNGCLPGFSEYAKSNRLRPSDPQQFLLFYHPKRGAAAIRPINLRDA